MNPHFSENSQIVLIVEDDLSLKPFWEFILQRHLKNHQLEWAVDSESARSIYLRELSRGSKFSLIVLDLFLSGSETGLDLLDLLDHFEEDCPVLFVSSVDEKNCNPSWRTFISALRFSKNH